MENEYDGDGDGDDGDENEQATDDMHECCASGGAL